MNISGLIGQPFRRRKWLAQCQFGVTTMASQQT